MEGVDGRGVKVEISDPSLEWPPPKSLLSLAMGELDFRIDNSTPTLTRGDKRDSRLELIDFGLLWIKLLKPPSPRRNSGGSFGPSGVPNGFTLWDMMDIFSPNEQKHREYKDILYLPGWSE